MSWPFIVGADNELHCSFCAHTYRSTRTHNHYAGCEWAEAHDDDVCHPGTREHEGHA